MEDYKYTNKSMVNHCLMQIIESELKLLMNKNEPGTPNRGQFMLLVAPF